MPKVKSKPSKKVKPESCLRHVKPLDLSKSLKLLKKIGTKPKVAAVKKTNESEAKPTKGKSTVSRTLPTSSKKAIRKEYQTQGTLFVSKRAVEKSFRRFLQYWRDRLPVEALNLNGSKKSVSSVRSDGGNLQISEGANEMMALVVSSLMERVLHEAARAMFKDGRVTLETRDLGEAVSVINSNDLKLRAFEYYTDEQW